MQQGMQQGEARINTLNMILINAGRFEDLKRAVTDINYQSQLIKELLPKELQYSFPSSNTKLCIF